MAQKDAKGGGSKLKDLGFTQEITPHFYSVKEPVFPFVKFPGVDPLRGPEMRSTGEVMGIGHRFGSAYAKATLGEGLELPEVGTAFVSVRDQDKERVIEVAKMLSEKGFSLVATEGTCQAIHAAGIECQRINKVLEGRPHIVDLMKNGEISFIVNTTEGRQAIKDSFSIRREALNHRISYSTTIAGARASVHAMDYLDSLTVNPLGELHKELKNE